MEIGWNEGEKKTVGSLSDWCCEFKNDEEQGGVRR